MKYKVTVPPTMEQGGYTTIARDTNGQTKAQDALQDYNSARDHDGLPPLSKMPNGTKYEPIKEWVLWAKYDNSHGWEEETIEQTRKEIMQRLKEYRENAPQYNYKVTSRAQA